MCGIIGYTGNKNAGKIVLDGLKTLEYRGYDSAGVALLSKGANAFCKTSAAAETLSNFDDCATGANTLAIEQDLLAQARLSVFKKSGRVSSLASVIPESDFCAGIGHTRWATHGKASDKNAHPHLSPDGTIAIVHNGVIENYKELKTALFGETFLSDTDSEIIAHLLQRFCEDGYELADAINRTAEMMDGAVTFLAVRQGDERVYCYKRGAALVVGKDADGCYAASDMLALAGKVDYAAVLEDGETAVLSKGGYKIFKGGTAVKKKLIRVAEQGITLCDCNMRKEIAEIPSALVRTYNSFSSFPTDCIERLKKAKSVCIFACGTAYHAGLYGKEIFETVCKKPTNVYTASEAECARFVDKSTFAVFISQSGETADTVAALNRCKNLGAKSLAITNVAGSTLSFKADYTFLLDAGAEIAVAATKSYNCQLLALYLIASAVADVTVAKKTLRELLLSTEKLIKKPSFLAETANKNLFFIGKGADRITALEGALKFKEITYKMTDAYPAGELKHGPIALVDESSAVIAIATSPADKPRISAAVSELRARGAYVAAVSAVGDVGADATEILPPLTDAKLYPVAAVIPLQILALSTSCALGIDPDKPRNLAKSVTVI